MLVLAMQFSRGDPAGVEAEHFLTQRARGEQCDDRFLKTEETNPASALTWETLN